jgi:hypothetical protein
MMDGTRPDFECWYGASLGGTLCITSKTYVQQVRLMSHESESTQKAQLT